MHVVHKSVVCCLYNVVCRKLVSSFSQKHCRRVLEGKLTTDEMQRIGVFFNPATKHLEPLLSATEAGSMRRSVRKMLPKKSDSASPLQTPDSAAVRQNKYAIFAGDTADAATVRDDVDIYISYAPPPQGQDLLAFWHSQEKVLPGLTSIAHKVLSIVASSTSSERLFNYAENIFTDKRSRLAPEKLDDLLYLMWNSY